LGKRLVEKKNDERKLTKKTDKKGLRGFKK